MKQVQFRYLSENQMFRHNGTISFKIAFGRNPKHRCSEVIDEKGNYRSESPIISLDEETLVTPISIREALYSANQKRGESNLTLQDVPLYGWFERNGCIGSKRSDTSICMYIDVNDSVIDEMKFEDVEENIPISKIFLVEKFLPIFAYLLCNWKETLVYQISHNTKLWEGEPCPRPNCSTRQELEPFEESGKMFLRCFICGYKTTI